MKPLCYSLTFLIIIALTYCTSEQKAQSNAIIEKGEVLNSFINFDNIAQIEISNNKGPHYLTSKQWLKLKNSVSESISLGGLICKPKTLSLTFISKDKTKVYGYICGNVINFENEGFAGSFKFSKEINLHNY